MEILLTAILVSVILHTATGARSIGHNAALAVGATVALLGLFAGPISGSSMNPAPTPGPALAAGAFTSLSAYLARRPVRSAPPLGPHSPRRPLSDTALTRRVPGPQSVSGFA